MKQWLLVSVLGITVVFTTGQVTPTKTSTSNSGQNSESHRKNVNAAVTRGISYLISIQKPNGAISETEKYRTTLTSLAIMAMISVGHQPSDATPEGHAIRAGLDFVLQPAQQDASGYFGSADQSRMYGHGITTLMLTEVLGMGVSDEQDAIIRAKCEKAINLILRAQKVSKRSASHRGGWRYTPKSNDSDLSVTGWQIMALRSAKNDGFLVPDEAINDAVAYIKRTYNGTRPTRATTTFGYQPGDTKTPFSMTGVGILALALCGEQNSAEVRDAARWLAPYEAPATQKWFYYGTYYFAQAMNQFKGEVAATAQQRVDESLLALQTDSGSWGQTNQEEIKSGGTVYCTSMALLSLGVRYHYLPLYQR